MKSSAAAALAPAVASISRAGTGPVFALAGGVLIVLAGTTLALGEGRVAFPADTSIALPALEAGCDYVIRDAEDGSLFAELATADLDGAWGGFHYAAGGNAPARAGGDDVPAINPCSIWDLGFRPACADPRGMALVAGVPGLPVAPFWADIYLLARDHLDGTSRAGVTIADGDNCPQLVDGSGHFEACDFETVKTVLAHHGKQVPSYDEFRALAYGVTEKTSADRRAETTGLDPARTSRCGVMQATGQRYVWGDCGDPDTPRASIFGGYWHSDEVAGSRYAVVDDWPGDSSEWLGARGRSDHLQPDA
jgi:hypothetical protein